MRDQEDETINTYYGDQKSYVNHLNQLDESQLEQQNLLDSSLYVNPNEVNQRVDEFTNAIEQLNSFSCEDNTKDNDDIEEELEDEPDSYEEIENYEKEKVDEDYDDLDELHSLKNISSSSFFESEDIANYESSPETSHHNVSENASFEAETSNFNYAFAEDRNSSMSFEDISHEIEPESFSRNEEYDFEHETNAEQTVQNDYCIENDTMSDIDAIITNNITSSYAEPTYAFYKNQTTNYKDKLSSLSKYSRVTLEENEPETSNEEALNKAKDIAEDLHTNPESVRMALTRARRYAYRLIRGLKKR